MPEHERIEQGGFILSRQAGEDGQLPLIDAYGDGGFRLGGVRHDGSLLVTARGVHAVTATSLDAVEPAGLAALLQQDGGAEVLLVGCGQSMQMIPPALRAVLEQEDISFDCMDTGAAARTFNILMLEGRRAVALLMAI